MGKPALLGFPLFFVRIVKHGPISHYSIERPDFEGKH
ncbi:hypothetical protein SAMN05444003_2698 [Cognatiyoonia sediminum]|uniref:Uncharacterized protein n=1 Tax=Cognatiyoonia sediminum TaxID=1508389 RepID=A0A1M5RU52_9RHOB|nr:hypothetical protein SAMN05444003_2698 [Cognatiyoonia sediminum]